MAVLLLPTDNGIFVRIIDALEPFNKETGVSDLSNETDELRLFNLYRII